MSDILAVDLIHLYPENNARLHHTENYELIYMEPAVPVLRRGQPFTAVIRFLNRPFNSKIDIINLVFYCGKKPHITKGTLIRLRLSLSKPKNIDSKLWSASILNQDDTTIMLEIQTGINCPVGNWKLHIETGSVNPVIPFQKFSYESDIYILFNPWHKDDPVYMPEIRLLDEYVLTDVGKIWVGPLGTSRGREWIFGQFDKAILLGAMKMFERSNLQWTNRGDPIRVVRSISKMVNFNDDNGVLFGRWDGEYDDGTAPSAWTGSISIMEEFSETGETVKYGQCWVFAGVVTSICRALGIPSRVVSNLVSAHDSNATLSVDRYFDENNEALTYDPVIEGTNDSIWNYHVWNDVWMARYDLPKGYGGWQSIDATPQETSDGFYQCGPASLEAIRKGEVGFNYDVGFMVASVNADILNWKEDPNSEFGYKNICCNKYHIGRMILTKQPWIFDPNGDRDREDITSQYKAKEGSEAERLSLLNAIRGNDLAKRFYSLKTNDNEDVEFILKDIDRIMIGDSFKVTVQIRNKSDKPRTIKVSLSAGSVYYTGVKAKPVKKSIGEFKLKPKTSDRLSMVVTEDEYIPNLVEYCIMKIYAIATVTETNQTWTDEDDFQVLKPNIKIKIADEIILGKETDIILTFTNPLQRILTNCRFNIAGSGLIKNQLIPYRNIESKETVSITTKILPKQIGEQKLIATFVSKQLVDITGSAKIEVFESNELY